MRLVGRPLEVYQYLEPLYNDYRKVERVPSPAYITPLQLKLCTYILPEIL